MSTIPFIRKAYLDLHIRFRRCSFFASLNPENWATLWRTARLSDHQYRRLFYHLLWSNIDG